MTEGLQALTDKEKQALRLILHGHDAKSSARQLGLSVHTINERLRIARRKLAVTSSREAARLLREREAGTPEILVYEQMGDDRATADEDGSAPPSTRHGAGQGKRPRSAVLAGVTAMFIVLASLALTATPGSDPAVDNRAAAVAARDTVVEAAAREWLALVDAGRWHESFDATGDGFRAVNTVNGWEAASRKVRHPLGRPEKRTAIAFENVPVPPDGAVLVRFRTDFTERDGAVETLTLRREEGRLKVVGYYVE